nr:hypothetical protein [Pedobacter panaciterrae]
MLFFLPKKLPFVKPNLVLIVLFTFFQLDASAQVKANKQVPPPKIKLSSLDSRKQQSNGSPVLKIIEQAMQELPLAFAWQINADTVLKADDVFREIIEFEGVANLRRSIAVDTVTLKKSMEKDYDVRWSFLKFSNDLTSYEFTQQKGKDILVFENTETHEKQYFKVFLDKSRKKILKLQHVATGHFYFPVQFEGGLVSG